MNPDTDPEQLSDEPSDEIIAKQVQDGNAEAFGILVERFEPKLLRYATKFLMGPDDGHDLVQDVFLKAYVNINSFDSSRSFSAWIYRIAHNEFINAIKKKGREPISFFDPDTLFPHPVAPKQADTNLHSAELKEMVERFVDRLDPKYREPLVLYYYEDMDYKQISKIMKIPVSTAGVRINRAKQALHKFQKEFEDGPDKHAANT